MNRLHFVFMLWFTIALAACTQSGPEAASTTSQETPSTPPAVTTPIEVTQIVVEVTRIGGTAEPSASPIPLDPADYPPATAPYYVPGGDFWLAHLPAGQLVAFSPTSPPYRADISLDACRFTWSESALRFVDPCSGDEWELNGQLNLKHSTELWSNSDLDQYVVRIYEGQIFVELDHLVPGKPVNTLPWP